MRVCFGVLCECCSILFEISGKEPESGGEGIWTEDCVADGAEGVGDAGGMVGRSVDEVGEFFEGFVLDFDEVGFNLGMTSRRREGGVVGCGFSGVGSCGKKDGGVMRWGFRVGGRAVDVDNGGGMGMSGGRVVR